jgi:hypothetical protein
MIENEIYMAGPQVIEADIEIVLDALRNGWYGKDATLGIYSPLLRRI